jgi:hypothetical protein
VGVGRVVEVGTLVGVGWVVDVGAGVYVGSVVIVAVGGGTVAVNVGGNVGRAVTAAVFVGMGEGVGVWGIVGGIRPGGVPYPGCRNCSLIISACPLSLIYGAIRFTSGVTNG